MFSHSFRLACRLTFLPLFLLPAAALGAAGAWSPLGPDGGAVTAIAVHPTAPATLYAAVEFGGVFRSDDGGASWRRTGPGLPQISFQALAGIAIDPLAPDTLYVPTNSGLFRSIDGGGHWQQVGGTLGQGPSFLYAIAAGGARPGIVYLADVSGVLKSGDGGVTWTRLQNGLAGRGAGYSLAIDPGNGNVVYLGTGGPLLKTTNGGATWAPAAGDPSRGPIGAIALAIDPRDPRKVYAGTANGVLRSTDAGRTWTLVVNGLTDRHVFALALAPSVPATLYAGTNAGVFVTRNAGGAWRRTSGEVQRVHALAVSRTSFATAWAGLWPAPGRFGLLVTTDAGRTWSPAQQGMAAAALDRIAVDPFDSQTLYAAGSGGFYRSGDRGASWTQVSAPFGAGSRFTILATDASTPGRLFAARVPFGEANPTLFRSLDHGDHWQQLALPVTTFLYSLLVLPGNRLLLATHAAGALRSGDGGDTWTTATGEMQGTVIQDLAAAGSVVYAAGYKLVGDPRFVRPELRLFKSADSGQTWTRSESGLPDSAAAHVAVDPGDPASAWVFVAEVLHHTADGGAHWTPVSDFFNRQQVVHDLLLVPGSPVTLYVATQNAGVFRSADGGKTWTAIARDLFSFNALALAVDPHDAGQLYAVLAGGGVVTLTEPAAIGCTASSTTLCLNQQRFEVEVAWQDFQGHTGAGQAVPLSGDTGYFWFFAPANVELVVKVIDGREANGFFWAFYGALSSVEYHVRVTDTATGLVRVYSNPAGRLASFADTRAFAGGQ